MVVESDFFQSPEALQDYCRDRFDVSLTSSDANGIVAEFCKLRKNGGWAAQGTSSAGFVVWISERLRKLGLFDIPHVDPGDIRCFALLHFWPWEGEEWTDSFEDVPDFPTSVRRSPLSRLRDSSPVDRVARRIAGDGDKPCPYCRRYFRNPAALVIHLEERHEQDILKKAKMK